jgi:hypothetical protein
MNVLDKSRDSATLRLTTGELRLLFGVLAEVQGGPNAFDDEDWNMLIGMPRELAEQLLDQMQPVLDEINRLED